MKALRRAISGAAVGAAMTVAMTCCAGVGTASAANFDTCINDSALCIWSQPVPDGTEWQWTTPTNTLIQRSTTSADGIMNGDGTYVAWVRMGDSQGHYCLPPHYGLADMDEGSYVNEMFNNITAVYLSRTRKTCPSGTEPPPPPTCCAVRTDPLSARRVAWTERTASEQAITGSTERAAVLSGS